MSSRRDPTPPCADRGANPAVSVVAGCPDGPCGKDAVRNVTECCGSEILAAAKQAHGSDPTFVFGKTSSGFPAEVDLETGTIIVDRKSSLCRGTERVFFELANLSRKQEFTRIHVRAAAGKLGREDYTQAMERVEYDSLQETLPAIDKCKRKWGCEAPPEQTEYDHLFSKPRGQFDRYRSARDFDHYYDEYLLNDHKDYYRKEWDQRYKAAYKIKQRAGK